MGEKNNQRVCVRNAHKSMFIFLFKNSVHRGKKKKERMAYCNGDNYCIFDLA